MSGKAARGCADQAMEAFTAAGRSLYQSCIPAGDDWDIFLACEVSVAAQRAMNDGRELVRTLTYGELDFEALAAIIYSIKYNHGYLMEGAKFYDLGSGTGKAVIAAACLHSFSTCVGVELLEGLHRVALTHKATWDAGETEGRPAVEFLQGSILDWAAGDWSDGDVLFANSHCFSEDMMQDISAKAGI